MPIGHDEKNSPSAAEKNNDAETTAYDLVLKSKTSFEEKSEVKDPKGKSFQ